MIPWMIAHGWSISQEVAKFIPFILFLELPFQVFVTIGVFRYAARRATLLPATVYTPTASMIVTAYDEGGEVAQTIRSLAYQMYDGAIDVIVVVDGARDNPETLAAANGLLREINALPRRSLRVVPKWERGGRVSSLNAGLELARGEICLAIDGDTSFDNDMVQNVCRHFREPNVAAVAGSLRVRNSLASIWASLQSLEYMLSIAFARTGLSQFNIVNNVSGAFGVFRTDLLRQVGGWNTGTAEDLDLTIRLKQYFHRFPGLRIRFEPTAIGHTDVPVSLRQFLRQRLRWDGDLFHTYFRTHGNAFSPDLVGWPNFIALVWCGLLWQVVLPFLIFATTIVSFDRFPMGFLAFILVLYCYYIIVMSVQFGIYIALISERKREDLMFWPVVAMLPFYGFMMRIWSVVALLDGAFLNGHLDSNMAPYWVLKMGRH